MNNKILFSTFLLIVYLTFSHLTANAQINLYKDSIRNFYMTGYIQAQYEKADSAGIPSYAGGDFPSNVDSRFMVRRSRMALGYSQKYLYGNLEIDVIQNNIRVTNAYVQFKEQYFNAVSAGLGLTEIPFGLETPYSSFGLESAERSRLIQTLFPDEKDCGAQIAIAPPESSKWSFISGGLAIVNGSGRNFIDYDSKKNFIGTLQFNVAKKLTTKSIPILAAGISYYNGGSRSNTTTMFYNGYNNGTKGFTPVTDAKNEGGYANRTYKGVNAQVGIKWKAGLSKLHFEYINGEQPGVAPSANINGPQASRSFGTQPLTNIYNRKFNGYYFMFNQTIANSAFNLMIKYDWYDPNTFVAGKEIGAANSNTTEGDIAYSTWGFGAYLNLLKNKARVAVYYDFVKNENTSIAKYATDIHDNVLNLRLQFKF